MDEITVEVTASELSEKQVEFLAKVIADECLFQPENNGVQDDLMADKLLSTKPEDSK